MADMALTEAGGRRQTKKNALVATRRTGSLGTGLSWRFKELSQSLVGQHQDSRSSHARQGKWPHGSSISNVIICEGAWWFECRAQGLPTT